MPLFIIVFSVSGLAQSRAFFACYDYFTDKDFVSAVECFTNYLDKNPKDADALNVRAKCYKYLKDYPLAFSDINSAIKLYNKNTIASLDGLYAQRGKFYEDIEKYEDALKDFAKALKINSKNTDVMFERANLYYRLENYAASDADWKLVLKIEKENINAQIGLARNMFARGKVDEAIKEFDRLEKIDFRNPYIYLYRSKAYDKKENYRKSIDDFFNWCYYDDLGYDKLSYIIFYADYEFTYLLAKISEKVVKDTDNKYFWLLARSVLYAEKDMYKEAIKDLNSIELLMPKPEIFLYNARGDYYTEMGEYDKAITEFNKGLNLDEKEELYLRRADAKRLKGDYLSAIEDFTKVIELDPMNSYAYYKRGWTKEFIKDFQGALLDYNTSVDIDNEYPYIYETRGRLYRNYLNQPQLAEKDFQMVLTLETEVRKGGNCRQYALFHLNRIEDAITHQNAILDKYPTQGNYYDATCLYSLMNRPEEAVKYLQLAFEKGFRDFTHIANDDDLDNIRNSPEFIKLIEEWKEKLSSSLETGQLIEPKQNEIKKYVVKSKELKSGVYEIPCIVNDLPLNFIFDTGASDITISSIEAAFMLKNNYLTEYDFKDRRNYRTASGDIVEGTKVKLKTIKIGDLELNNIEAAVVHKQNAPLLFGQSALGKFVKITIDNSNNEIIFEY